MKIVLFGRTDKGGMKTHILALKEELSKRHEVRVLCPLQHPKYNLMGDY